MKMAFVLFLFLVVSVCYTHCNQDDKRAREYRTKVEHGVDTFLKRGFISDYLSNLLGDLRDTFVSKIVDPAKQITACTICKIVLGVVLKDIRNGNSKEESLRNRTTDLCVSLKIQPRKVCAPLIQEHLEVIYYIVKKNPELTADRICATIMQNFNCKGDIPEWSIQIATGETKKRQWGTTSSEKLHILQITDIHYDALYTEGTADTCEDPLCCQKDSGPPNGTAKPAGHWSSYPKCDTPFITVEQTLKDIKKRHEKIDYIYFTGDIISHRIWDRTIESNKKDIKDINDLFRKIFPDVKVYSILGNHEPHPLNLFAPLGEKNFSTQWLYDSVAQDWSHWLPNQAIERVKKGGFYTVSPRKGFRIIALNSNPCYVYNWWLLDGTGRDPYGELEWLSHKLQTAEESNENVHILSHVPSGDTTCYKIWSREFRRLIERYSNTITGIFNGHTHYDEMILYHSKMNQSKAISVAWNGGSLTTYTDLNLNYRIYDVHPNNFEILDFHEYTFDLNRANTEKKINWFKLYSFKSAYNVSSLSPDAVRSLVVRMSNDKKLMEKYQRYMSRNSTSKTLEPCDESCLKNLHCNILRSDSHDTSQCSLLATTW